MSDFRHADAAGWGQVMIMVVVTISVGLCIRCVCMNVGMDERVFFCLRVCMLACLCTNFIVGEAKRNAF